MQVLLADPHVFTCRDDLWATIYHSEVGSSAAMLAAGHNLGSLMVRYRGVDWRDRRAWGCNGGLGPALAEHANDGMSLDPYEVLFVKVSSGLLLEQLAPAMTAAKYDAWLSVSVEQVAWGGET